MKTGHCERARKRRQALTAYCRLSLLIRSPLGSNWQNYWKSTLGDFQSQGDPFSKYAIFLFSWFTYFDRNLLLEHHMPYGALWPIRSPPPGNTLLLV